MKIDNSCIRLPAIILVLLLLLPLSAHAVNFYAGGKLTDGFNLNLYPYWYSADTRTGKSGSAAINNLGFEKYRKPKLVFAALKDVYTQNSTEGILVMGRIAISFQ